MKGKMKSIIIIISILLMATSCKKDNEGDATVIIFPQHHGMPVKGATIYVKFQTIEYPPDITSNYDLKIEGNPTDEYVRIEKLRYGNHFLFIDGYDSAIAVAVSTPLAINIKWSERKKEKKLNIPVSE